MRSDRVPLNEVIGRMSGRGARARGDDLLETSDVSESRISKLVRKMQDIEVAARDAKETLKDFDRSGSQHAADQFKRRFRELVGQVEGMQRMVEYLANVEGDL